MFQKKGQLGHPDEINAKKISLGRQMNTDEHGLTRIKKKVCFAFGEKGHIASRHLCISGRDLYGYNLRFRFDVNPEPQTSEP
jgi:hypothetical protein